MRIRARRLLRGFNLVLKQGEVADVPNQLAQMLLSGGLADKVGVETATLGPEENAALRTGPPKHLGGPWYLVNGEKIRGKAAAYAAMRG